MLADVWCATIQWTITIDLSKLWALYMKQNEGESFWFLCLRDLPPVDAFRYYQLQEQQISIVILLSATCSEVFLCERDIFWHRLTLSCFVVILTALLGDAIF